MNTNKFDDIRPYNNEEFLAAMQRIVDSEHFPLVAQYLYPDMDVDVLRSRMRNFTTIREFQHDVMYHVNEVIIRKSTSGLTYGGIQHLSPNERYLFVSNHRDIMLDACLLQYVLVINGHETSEITFGANLMHPSFVVDIGKSNKMFKVERPNRMNAREFYLSSMHLSEYIRYCITEKNESVWIAQRNGRTKDGIDLTDQGIIKMFSMSRAKEPVEALAELHIVPVAISYEWESCDILKARELSLSRNTVYVKQPGEDLNSILTGITQPKGQVHIEICPPITRSDLKLIADSHSASEFHREVAALIDKPIHAAYKLYPNNYIAHDLLTNTSQYSSYYSEEQKTDFLKYLNRVNEYPDCDQTEIRQILLKIYANPVNYKM